MKPIYRAIILLVSLWSAAESFSWDGAVDRKISVIQVTQANNYPFRISLVGNPTLCGNTHAWAYLSATDSSY